MNLPKIIMGLTCIRQETISLYGRVARIIYNYRQTGQYIPLQDIPALRRKLKFYHDNCPHLEELVDPSNLYIWCNTCGAFCVKVEEELGYRLVAVSDGITEIFGHYDDRTKPNYYTNPTR